MKFREILNWQGMLSRSKREEVFLLFPDEINKE